MKKFEQFYDKNYKKLLIIPAVLLIISLISIFIFYSQTGDVFNKDVSLTGGTTVTLFTEKSSDELSDFLSEKLQDYEVRALSDNTGTQTSVSVVVQEEQTQALEEALEEFLGEPLTQDNSSVETTSSSLSADFFKQLMVAIFIAFFWMAGVVFLIFAKGRKIKIISFILNIALGVLLGALFIKGVFLLNAVIVIALMIALVYIYIKNSVPSFAVMLSAFADLTMTLALVNFLGIKISTAGIVAFLMIIGYSVDTDVLLTTRILQRKNSANKELFEAFKTGTTMTLTSIVAVATALIVVSPFGSVLNQIFSVLLIGLGFDLFNTWVTNASILKWYSEVKQ